MLIISDSEFDAKSEKIKEINAWGLEAVVFLSEPGLQSFRFVGAPHREQALLYLLQDNHSSTRQDSLIEAFRFQVVVEVHWDSEQGAVGDLNHRKDMEKKILAWARRTPSTVAEGRWIQKPHSKADHGYSNFINHGSDSKKSDDALKAIPLTSEEDQMTVLDHVLSQLVSHEDYAQWQSDYLQSQIKPSQFMVTEAPVSLLSSRRRSL